MTMKLMLEFKGENMLDNLRKALNDHSRWSLGCSSSITDNRQGVTYSFIEGSTLDVKLRKRYIFFLL